MGFGYCGSPFIYSLDGFLLLHVRFLRVIHVAACSCLFLLLWCMNILHLFIHSPFGGHSLFAAFSCNIVECCSEHSCACPLGYTCMSFMWSCGSEWNCVSYSVPVLSFRLCVQFSRVVVPSHTWPSVYEYSSCSTALPSLMLSIFFLLTLLVSPFYMFNYHLGIFFCEVPD